MSGILNPWGVSPLGAHYISPLGARTRRGTLLSPFATIWKIRPFDRVLWTYDTVVNALGVAIDAQGSVYVCAGGLPDGPIAGSPNVWKLNAAGELIWAVATGQKANRIAVSSLGEAVTVPGFTSGIDVLRDACKLNPDGSRQWLAPLAETEPFRALPSDLAIDESDNIYVTGGHVRSLSPGGLIRWTHSVVPNWAINSHAIDARAGRVAFGFWSELTSTSALRMLDAGSGTRLWQHEIASVSGGSGSREPGFVAMDSGARPHFNDKGNEMADRGDNAVLVRLTSGGDDSYVSVPTLARSAALDASGRCALVGDTRHISNPLGSYSSSVRLVSADGAGVVWSYRVGLENDATAALFDVAADPAGDLVIVGRRTRVWTTLAP